MLRLQHQIYYKEKGNVFANVAFTTALTTRPPHVTAVQYSVQQCVKASFLQFGILSVVKWLRPLSLDVTRQDVVILNEQKHVSFMPLFRNPYGANMSLYLPLFRI